MRTAHAAAAAVVALLVLCVCFRIREEVWECVGIVHPVVFRMARPRKERTTREHRSRNFS